MSDDLIKRSDAIEVLESEDCLGYIECKTKALVKDIKAIPSADRPQGDVDAVDIFMREMHNLEQGYITIGEFDERIEPLRHLCYGRPQGKWLFIGDNMFECSQCKTSYTTQQLDGLRNYSTDPFAPNFCPNCGARMKGADDE